MQGRTGQAWIVGAALLVAGCGGGKEADGGAADTATAVASAAGSVASATAGQWPDSLPDFAPGYPGAAAEMTMAGASGQGQGTIVVFTTADPPEKVIAFYKEQAASAGLGNVSTMETGGVRAFNASDDKGRVLSVQASVEDGRTRGTLTVGTRAAG